MHALDDRPNFRWDGEAITPLLEHTGRRHMKIGANADDCPNRVEAVPETESATDDDF